MSTVAWTVYNLLTGARQPLTIEVLLSQINMTELHPGLTIEFLSQTMNEMECRQLVETSECKFVCPDRKRRRVISRDRSDALVDKKGIIHGGWNQWVRIDGSIL